MRCMPSRSRCIRKSRVVPGPTMQRASASRKIFDTTPGRMILGQLLPKHVKDPVRRRQQADDEERDLEHDRYGLPQLRAEGDRDLLRPDHGARLPRGVPRRHLVRQGRHGGAGDEARHRRGDPHARQGIRAAVQRWPDHSGREVQQGRRCLGQVHRQACRRDDASHLDDQAGRQWPRSSGELHLHDGAFRCAWLACPDEAARCDARPHGQALGRDHRDADHLKLQGRLDRPRIFQLDPRRPQGSCGYGVEDGELRLPHPSSRGRCTGRHHHDPGLRIEGWNPHACHHRRRPGGGIVGDPHSRPHDVRGFAERRRERDRRGRRDDPGMAYRPHQCGRHSGGEDPLGADLRGEERRLRQVLRA